MKDTKNLTVQKTKIIVEILNLENYQKPESSEIEQSRDVKPNLH